MPPPPLLRVTTTASAVHLPQARPLTPGVEERSWSINTQDKAQRSGGADQARGPSQRTGKEQASSSPHMVPPREEPLSGDSRPGLLLAVAHGLHRGRAYQVSPGSQGLKATQECSITQAALPMKLFGSTSSGSANPSTTSPHQGKPHTSRENQPCPALTGGQTAGRENHRGQPVGHSPS